MRTSEERWRLFSSSMIEASSGSVEVSGAFNADANCRPRVDIWRPIGRAREVANVNIVEGKGKKVKS
tara:strand:- start:219 stop:419 length:201 start_codon:yes stop_codon:yes gene_type:complete